MQDRRGIDSRDSSLGFFGQLSFAFAPGGSCPVIDDLTSQGKSILKDLNLTPQMVSLLEEKGEKGDAKVQWVLGWIYFVGEPVAKNDERAVQWMTKAANQNVPYAQTQLGLMYLLTKDMEGHYTLAREWLLKGAERNENDALNALGVIYSQGLGVEVNGIEAVKYFHEAAEAGFDKAQYNLAFLYYEGKVVPRALKEAPKWFQLAAQQGHARRTSWANGAGRGALEAATEAVRDARHVYLTGIGSTWHAALNVSVLASSAT